MKNDFVFSAKNDYYVTLRICDDMIKGLRPYNQDFIDVSYQSFFFREPAENGIKNGKVAMKHYHRVMFHSFLWGIVLSQDSKGYQAIHPNTYALHRVVNIAQDILEQKGVKGMARADNPEALHVGLMLSGILIHAFEKDNAAIINPKAKPWLHTLPKTWVDMGRQMADIVMTWKSEDVATLLGCDPCFYASFKDSTAHEKMRGQAISKIMHDFFMERIDDLYVEGFEMIKESA